MLHRGQRRLVSKTGHFSSIRFLVVACSSTQTDRPARIIVKEVPRELPNGRPAASQDKLQAQPHADVKPDASSSQAQQSSQASHNQAISERTPAVKPVNGETNSSALVWQLAVHLMGSLCTQIGMVMSYICWANEY